MISRSKASDKYKDQSKGKNRYQRRLHSKITNSVKEMNSIDMNSLFKDDKLDVQIKVQGETDDYIIRISFFDFLEKLHEQLQKFNDKLSLTVVTKALTSAFNGDNVYIHCTCPDWKYRMAFYATKNDINSGEPELRPSDITNPNDTKGPGCKHVMLAISNNTWLIRLASTVYNYIRYMEKHYQKQYADIIYPAIYQKPYEDEVQLDFTDNNLETDRDFIQRSNEFARKRGQFQKGNEYRFQPQDRIDPDQIDFDNLV